MLTPSRPNSSTGSASASAAVGGGTTTTSGTPKATDPNERCTACSSSGICTSSRALELKRSSSGSMRLNDLCSARSVREPGMLPDRWAEGERDKSGEGYACPPSPTWRGPWSRFLCTHGTRAQSGQSWAEVKQSTHACQQGVCRFEFVVSAPTQQLSPGGRQARPTKLERSKCDSARCASANASQLSVARNDTAPTCAKQLHTKGVSALWTAEHHQRFEL